MRETASFTKNNKENGFINGAFSLAFAAILVKICGMLFKVPLSYILGDEGMGYFNSAYTVYSFFYILCSAGVPKAVTMLVTKSRADSELTAEKAFKATLSLFFKIGLVLTVVFLVFSSPLSSIIGNKRALYTMVFIAPSLVLVCISGVMRGYLNSYFALRFVAVSQLIEALGKLVLGLIFAFLAREAYMSLPLISAFATLGISIGSFISSVYLYRRAKTVNKAHKKGQKCYINKKSIYKDIFKIAIPISLSSALLNLSGIIDLALIMHRLKASGISEEAASGLYGNYTTLAVPMLTLVVSVTTPIAIAVFPKLTESHLKKDDSSFSKELNTSCYLMMLISAPAAFSFLLYSQSVLDVLYSTEAAKVGANMLSALSFGVILLSLLTLFNTALESKGRIRASVISLIIGSLVKSTLGYTLIGRGEIGILGAPLGTVVSYLISILISSFYLFKGDIRLNTFASCLSPILIASFSFIIPKLLWLYFGLSDGFFSDFLLLCISFILYSVVVLLSNKDIIFMIKSNIFNKKRHVKAKK